MASDRVPHTFPKFADTDEERRHRKQRLAAAFRLFGQFGFDEGVAGHITARDPEHLDHFWVNPMGMSFKQIRVKDLLTHNASLGNVDFLWYEQDTTTRDVIERLPTMSPADLDALLPANWAAANRDRHPAIKPERRHAA